MSPDARSPHALSVAIIGGGIGGLTTAIALQQAGVTIRLFEQAPELTQVGAGIGLFPNGMRVMTRLGLSDEILRRANQPPDQLTLRWQDAKVLTRSDMTVMPEQYGIPYVTLHRAHLLDALLGAVDRRDLALDHHLTGLQRQEDKISLAFANGEAYEADLVVGADGVRSTVAAAAGFATQCTYAGFAAYRSLVPRERLAGIDIPDGTTVWLGPRHAFAHYWIGADRALLNVIGYVERETIAAHPWSAAASREELAEHYADWHPVVGAIIAACDSVTAYGMFDRLAEPRWDDDRVVLLGDAAHPMLASYAQGAGQAMEDSIVIAELLRGATRDDVPRRLELFSRLRSPRVRRLQELARATARSNFMPDGPEQRARDERLTTASHWDARWIYEFDGIAAVREMLTEHEGVQA